MNIKNIIVIVLLVVATLSTSLVALAMGHRPKLENAQKQDSYFCPMHPNEMSDKPGSCSICGMALIKKDSAVKQRPTCSCCGMKK